MERRLSKRLFTRIKTRYGIKSHDFSGLALNLSARGMFLSSRRLFPTGTILQLQLLPVSRPAINLTGRVAWSKQIPVQMMHLIDPGMGLSFLPVPKDYLDYFISMFKSASAKRDELRFELRLEVCFYYDKEFLKEYTENISKGGMFINTEKQIQPNTILDIYMIIPDIATIIPLKGRVVYQLDKEAALRSSCQPGVGIQILELSEELKKMLEDYKNKLLRFLEQIGI